MQGNFAFLATARNVDHDVCLFAEARVQGVSEQDGGNAQPFRLAQGGLPFPVGGFLRHHHQHIATLELDKLFSQPDSRTVERRRRQPHSAKHAGGVLRQNARCANAKNGHLPRLAQQRHRLRHGVTIVRF
ncbi:hypothetical protein D3C80_1780280 [compost metagenome]